MPDYSTPALTVGTWDLKNILLCFFKLSKDSPTAALDHNRLDTNLNYIQLISTAEYDIFCTRIEKTWNHLKFHCVQWSEVILKGNQSFGRARRQVIESIHFVVELGFALRWRARARTLQDTMGCRNRRDGQNRPHMEVERPRKLSVSPHSFT